MLRDSIVNRVHLRTMKGVGGHNGLLPMPVYMGHPVACNPTGEPSYIDGQIADILVEIQEAPLRPFTEGEAIGTIEQNTRHDNAIHGVSKDAYDRMAQRVWTAHHKLTRAAKRREYTTDRQAEGETFRFTWVPALDAFVVRKLS